MSEEELHETIKGLYGTIKHHKELGISLIHKNADIQRRIDKAIEYIESIENRILKTATKSRLNSDEIIDELDYENSGYYIKIKKDKLLSILKGDD